MELARSVFLRLAGAAALAAFAAAPAAAAFGAWANGDKARVRLVAVGVGGDGSIAAGIEIEIDPGWHTYWRNPGDAGIPPAIDFSASRNVASAEVAFPAPERLDDGYSTSNVYLDRVVLPVSARRMGEGDVELVLSLDIGVCAEVCVPEHFAASVTVPPGNTDKAVAALLDEARQALPGSPVPGSFAVAGIRRAGGSDTEPAFEIALLAPDAAKAEVFVESPADWYAGPPVFARQDGEAAIFTVVFNRKTATTPISGSSLRVTAVSGDRAFEQILGLD